MSAYHIYYFRTLDLLVDNSIKKLYTRIHAYLLCFLNITLIKILLGLLYLQLNFLCLEKLFSFTIFFTRFSKFKIVYVSNIDKLLFYFFFCFVIYKTKNKCIILCKNSKLKRMSNSLKFIKTELKLILYL